MYKIDPDSVNMADNNNERRWVNIKKFVTTLYIAVIVEAFLQIICSFKFVRAIHLLLLCGLLSLHLIN